MARDIAEVPPFCRWLQLVHDIGCLVERVDPRRKETLVRIKKHRVAKERVDGELRLRYVCFDGIAPKTREISKVQCNGAQRKIRVRRCCRIGWHIERVDCRQIMIPLELSERGLGSD